MEIVDLLEKEHEEVNGLFQQYFGGGTLTRLVNKVVGSRPPGRKGVARKICDALDQHTRLEEEVFYPEVRATGDRELNQMVDEGEREHAGVKEKVARARTLFDDEAALEETMSAIQGDVDHHVREEETEMFPRLRDVMSEQKRNEIGRRYAARKRAQKGRGVARSGPAAGTRRKTAASSKRRTVTSRSVAGRRKTRAKAKQARGTRRR
jgi:iron-sulfur cluster repair protein YtfE (RIC family)